MLAKSPKETLHEAIVKHAFVSGKEKYIASPLGEQEAWMFDFRNILLRPEILEAYTDIFFARFANLYPFQVGGLEVASLPLIAAIVLKSHSLKKPINGFFIRKSRKKTGLMNMIEGNLTNDPIILVDDILNSGSTFQRQISALEKPAETTTNPPVISIFSILRYREPDAYSYFSDKKIVVDSIFTLADFSHDLAAKAIIDLPEKIIAPNAFATTWYWQSPQPNYQYVKPKSGLGFSPTHKALFCGTDHGTLTRLNSNDGTVDWEYTVALGKKTPAQFSTPLISEETVYFGSYDGNLYALDILNGKRRWVFLEADWIESTPCLDESKKRLFVVVQYGVFKKSSALVAIDTKTGKKIWEYRFESISTAAPAYSKKYEMVYCGDSTGNFYAISTKTGKKCWQIKTPFNHLAAPGLDEDSDKIIVGGQTLNEKVEDDGSSIHIYKAETGNLLTTYSELLFGIHTTPITYQDLIIVTSLDKCIHAFSKETGRRIWHIDTGARIFATPVILSTKFGTRLYVGSNNSILYEIEPLTGKITSMTYVTERITNPVIYDNTSETIFLPTYANEIYALKRK